MMCVQEQSMNLAMTEKATPRPLWQWPPELAAEFQRNQYNGCVGTELVSESQRVRVWMIHLAPGQRIAFHRHVLDYFWTAVTTGRGRQRMHDGTTIEKTYSAGETRHETYQSGEYKIHDLENLGDTELVFTTVEFLDSANKPLPVPDSIRSTSIAG
jgi:quercetin dioxygenase-like cupin family protein